MAVTVGFDRAARSGAEQPGVDDRIWSVIELLIDPRCGPLTPSPKPFMLLRYMKIILFDRLVFMVMGTVRLNQVILIKMIAMCWWYFQSWDWVVMRDQQSIFQTNQERYNQVWINWAESVLEKAEAVALLLLYLFMLMILNMINHT
jgi:hypothetical protein